MESWYYLMNGDEIVMLLRQVQDLDEMSYVEAERRSSYVPYGFTTPDAWIESRQIAKHRKQIYAMMQTDDVHEYLKGQGPRIGAEFVSIARAVLTPKYRSLLINLKDFEYADPGFRFPSWKLDLLNRIKNEQIDKILGK